MDQSSKRKAPSGGDDEAQKRTKTKKQWRVPRPGDQSSERSRVIQPGDRGIWATCTKGKERKCIGELRDLFAEYAELLYSDQMPQASSAGAGAMDVDSTAGEGVSEIEKEIQQELQDIRKPASALLFESIMIDVQCVVFFRTRDPVDPVAFVRSILEDAAREPARKKTRFTQRLSPMTFMGKANEEGLEKVAMEVLPPHFHAEPVTPRKFAIRPTLRNHNVLNRDVIIKKVASMVGNAHSVDLKNYDSLILVEVFQNICGMSVVAGDFEQLKRYNLTEIFEPTPKDGPAMPV